MSDGMVVEDAPVVRKASHDLGFRSTGAQET
jgi:hypothetical protein